MYLYENRMASDFEQIYRRLLAQAGTVVEELEDIDSDEVTRENWTSEFSDFNDSLDEFEETQAELFAELFDATSGKGRIREFMRDNVGEVVTTQTLARISGIQDYQRRIRELRNEEGFIADSTRTRSELSNDEYYIKEIRDVNQKTRLPNDQRLNYLEETNYECELCGRNVNDKKVNWVDVDHIQPYVEFGTAKETHKRENLQTLRNRYHDGKSAREDIANQRRDGDTGAVDAENSDKRYGGIRRTIVPTRDYRLLTAERGKLGLLLLPNPERFLEDIMFGFRLWIDSAFFPF
ncbi:HNH endonuclease [Halorussus caseinilyticus]|uniref:HNH endonuclease n=1 Tax=Halorussus caseinilyticus TaxID=3034025 RepID=UPI0023E77F1F|nr:HNH endonuclease [Halorussus sp. DT72]